MEATATMTVQEIANRLVELCRMGQYEAAQRELLAENVVSREPSYVPNFETVGLEACIEKGKYIQSMNTEYHGGSVSDPIVSGRFFTVAMMMDVTQKERGRVKMEEIGVYEVKDGKIVLEEFFY
jgi:hypothetical protein